MIEITKREVILSITIIAIMFCIGIFITDKISDSVEDANAVYRKAQKFDDTDLFSYGMRTDIGNAFVYGTLNAIDGVTYPDISDDVYMYAQKVKEEYTMHTKTVSHTRTVNGKTKTYYTTETYYSWDVVDRDSKKVKEVEFCGVVFPIDKIDIPSSEYLKTVKTSFDTRYKYYVVKKEYQGSIYTKLKDNTIQDGTYFYKDMTAEELFQYKLEDATVLSVLFWFFWIIATGFLVYGFYALDNKWLK